MKEADKKWMQQNQNDVAQKERAEDHLEMYLAYRYTKNNLNSPGR